MQNTSSTSTANLIKCDKFQCDQKSQAVCFACCECYCFKHSMQHSQTNIEHNLLEIDQSIKHISLESKQYLNDLVNIRQLLQVQKIGQKNEAKLTPQKFQQQLDQISFMKKQILKIVEKFFSEVSLQLVNIWEVYLKKYSGKQVSNQIYQDLISQLSQYTQPWKLKLPGPQIIKQYFRNKFNVQVENYKQKLNFKSAEQIPACPELIVQSRILVQLSQLLCSSISTRNYRSSSNSNIINIRSQNFLQSKNKYLPIFPIKRQHCYLYNLNQKQYQIQQFNKLQLPAFPKTIVLPNNDLHLIGGLSSDTRPLKTHLVFRCSTSQIYKLPDLLSARNPINALCYANNNIFIIGGMINQIQWDEKCFKFCLNQKQWKSISSMHSIKQHQSCCTFGEFIYCFGMPDSRKVNIQKYSLNFDKWEQISIENALSNPFNFACGFCCLQINKQQILMFGGKKFLETNNFKKRSTDRLISPYMYTFRGQNNSFTQLGPLNSCNGVQYGELNPFINNGKVVSAQFIISKNHPIVRWYDTLQVVEINSNGVMETSEILHEN